MEAYHESVSYPPCLLSGYYHAVQRYPHRLIPEHTPYQCHLLQHFLRRRDRTIRTRLLDSRGQYPRLGTPPHTTPCRALRFRNSSPETASQRGMKKPGHKPHFSFIEDKSCNTTCTSAAIKTA